MTTVSTLAMIATQQVPRHHTVRMPEVLLVRPDCVVVDIIVGLRGSGHDLRL